MVEIIFLVRSGLGSTRPAVHVWHGDGAQYESFVSFRNKRKLPRCKRLLRLYFRRVQILIELEIEGRFAFQGKLDGRLLYKAMMPSM